jgi:hypothetical protein
MSRKEERVDHFRILKRAFEITWKYRALWLIGLLLVLAGGGVMSGANPSPNPRVEGSPSGGNGIETPYRGHIPSWPEVRAIVLPILAIVAIVIGILLLLAVVTGIAAAIVRYVTQGSLIRMVQSYEETGEQIGFRGGWRMGWSRSAIRLWLINLVLKLPIALIMGLLIAPAIAVSVLSFARGSGMGIALGVASGLMVIPIILLGVAIRLAIGPIQQLAYRLCVIEELGVWAAIQASFRMARRHLGAVALQWLLLIGLGIAWSVVMIPVGLMLVILALLIGGAPALLVGGVTALIASWPVGLVLGLLVMVPLFIVLVGAPSVALSTLATVFYSTTWTLTYRELKAIEGRDAEDVLPGEGVSPTSEGVLPSEEVAPGEEVPPGEEVAEAPQEP